MRFDCSATYGRNIMPITDYAEEPYRGEYAKFDSVTLRADLAADNLIGDINRARFCSRQLDTYDAYMMASNGFRGARLMADTTADAAFLRFLEDAAFESGMSVLEDMQVSSVKLSGAA